MIENNTIGACYGYTTKYIFEFKDETNIHITQKDAINLTSVHDTLNEDNQNKMRVLLEESENEYTKVLDFCNKQFNE